MNQDINSLQKNGIELIHPNIVRGKMRIALFDFDGTLSLIREGWQGIMISMMVEILEQTPRHEDHASIEAVVVEFVTQLTGKQTIYQMMQLCDEIKLRGGKSEDPLVYKNIYNEKLYQHIHQRIYDLQHDQVDPVDMMVAGALDWLILLKKRGIQCYLASGTDVKYVHAEASLLGLNPYFSGIYGALDDLSKYSKKKVIGQIISENKLTGPEFAVFGDGFVEIEESKAVGGIAVGVASSESARHGVDEWKRHRLISAGADLIIPDFRRASALEKFLFKEY